MRVLLSDGSGLTARQAATQLAEHGHTVHALSPDPLCLTRFTRRVQRVHRVPPYGADPLHWLDAALAAYRSAGMDVLLPTQEQVAVLSAVAARVRAAGVRTAVPSFSALARVQDKVSAFATLAAAGLPQPPGTVLETPGQAARLDRFPVFLKLPIGTATSGVGLITDPAGRDRFVAAAGATGAFAMGGLLAQQPADGPLVMAQCVFDRGELVAWHACLRVREGTSGGASHKRSASLPAIREHLAVLGRELGWHGALSADAILGDGGPCYIDINPRLVEPGNAWRAGVDLVTPMLDLAGGTAPPPQPGGRPDVRTHQLLIALLGAAQRTGRRRDVAAELLAAARRAGDYAGSTEELTPVRGDPRAAVPAGLAAAATLIRPAAWRWFAAGSVRNYALSPAGWRALLDLQPPG
jgi:biotin carboxylase